MSRLPTYQTRAKQVAAFARRQRVVRAAAVLADEIGAKAILTRLEAELVDAVQDYRRNHPARCTFPDQPDGEQA